MGSPSPTPAGGVPRALGNPSGTRRRPEGHGQIKDRDTEGPGAHSPARQTRRGWFAGGTSTRGVRKHADRGGSTGGLLASSGNAGGNGFSRTERKGERKKTQKTTKHYRHKKLLWLRQFTELHGNYKNSLFSDFFVKVQAEHEEASVPIKL